MSLALARRILYATVAFVAGLLGARALMPDASPTPLPLQRAVRWPDTSALPRLALIDQTGAAFDGSAFRGRWTYAFLGFTSCPDVCPTTLTVLAEVRRRLGDLPAARQPAVLLVTVDPERDDAARLSAYLQHFDATFRGVTGKPEEIARLASALHAAYARVEMAGGGYTMDHASSLFVIGPDGNLVATSGAPHDAAVIADDYRVLAGTPTAALAMTKAASSDCSSIGLTR